MNGPVCNCEHCQAADRMNALARVFDDVGNHTAAEVCREWGLHAQRTSQFGSRMSAAIVKGVYLNGS